MTARIPGIFHFVFGLRERPEPLHLVHYLCLASCLEVNRPEAVYLHYHHEPFGRYWDLIAPRLTPVRVEPVDLVERFRYPSRFTKRFRYAHHADFVRIEKLVERGGTYADLDTIFVSPIPPELRDQPFVIGREDDIVDPVTGQRRESLCNAFLMAEPDTRFGRLWLEEMGRWFDGSWSRHSTLLPRALANAWPDLVHIEPSRTFYKHMWTREGIETLLRGLDTDLDGVVSFHLWSHLWWDRRRRDFSDFHAGLLTEEYVRTVDTTYNLVARPYLPNR